MGVFARLFRRSKTAEGASTAEAQADTPTAEPVAEEAAAAEESVEAKAGDADRSAPTEAESVEADTDDGVDIPQQQSAGKAADSEAGEGART